MKLLFAIALATLTLPALAASSPGPASQTEQVDREKYDAEIGRMRAGDLTSVDWRWMRIQRAKRNGYYFSDWEMKDRSQVYALLDKGKTKEAQALVQGRLTEDFLDPRAHVAAAIVARSLNLPKQQALHDDIIKALLASIRRGKSGRTAEESWQASYVGEEYFILWMDRYKVKSQRLANANGHVYDVMRCVDEDTNQEVEIWFEIDSFFGKAFK
jgi:hypothetical protein